MNISGDASNTKTKKEHNEPNRSGNKTRLDNYDTDFNHITDLSLEFKQLKNTNESQLRDDIEFGNLTSSTIKRDNNDISDIRDSTDFKPNYIGNIKEITPDINK